MDISGLDAAEQVRLLELMKEQEARVKYNKIKHFEPYQWQKDLAYATEVYKQIAAMCANQIGKSTAGAYITACHLTGIYPEGWKGHKFEKPIYSWASGVSTDTTRDIVQAELFGLAEDPTSEGTGMVPLDCIGEKTRRRGASGNTYDSILVKHVHPTTGKFNGWSRLGFKSYEMGEEKFFGRPVDWIWLDEQPPSNIYTQCITRTVATNGYVMCTFTPEDGITPMVHQFMNDPQEGQLLLQATWEDAPHLDEATKKQLLAQYPEQEGELRSKGIPIFGSGLVFPVSRDKISVTPFNIPDNWPRICGVDFGWDHPAAGVWVALDPNTDTVYIYDCYSARKTLSPIHASMINERGSGIPVAWPRDGLQTRDGQSYAEGYRNNGVNMLPDWFTNPPNIGEEKGNDSVEAGCIAMLERMETGRLKVFAHLEEFWLEFSSYHRKDGKIQAVNDDVMSAARYAVQSVRFARGVGTSSDDGYHYSGELPVRDYSYT